jgi:hypothetical protein
LWQFTNYKWVITGYKSDDTFHKRGDLVHITSISGEITKDCIFLNGKSLEDHGVFMGESKGGNMGRHQWIMVKCPWETTGKSSINDNIVRKHML